jgi:hypothetical protein
MFFRILDTKIKVSDIVSYKVRKRWFCIRDRDLPLVLDIEYKDPRMGFEVAPILGKGIAVLLSKTYKPTSRLGIRLGKSEADEKVEQLEHLMWIQEQEELKKEKQLLKKYGINDLD